MEPVKRSGIEESSNDGQRNGIYIYSVPISVCLGLQYLLPVVVPLLYAPLQLLPLLCLLPDDPDRGEVLSKVLFLSGLSTVVQALFGVRSPAVVAPSLLFVHSAVGVLSGPHWERTSESETYAMGPARRHEAFRERSAELQGLLVIASLGLSLATGLLWYFKTKLPPATRSATLITTIIVNVIQVIPESRNFNDEKSSMPLLAIGLLLLFLIIQNVKLPLKVVGSEDSRIMLRVFKVFGVVFVFIICITANIFTSDPNAEYNILRAARPYKWLSFNFLPLDFNVPTVSLRSWLLFPAILSQTLSSLGCYGLLNKTTDRGIRPILCEGVTNVIASLCGLPLLLSIDLAALGLWSQTGVNNSETTLISGSLLLVVSSFLQVVAQCSYVPYGLVSVIYVYLHGQVIYKALSELDQKSDDLKIVVVSSLSALMISLFFPGIYEETHYSIWSAVARSPVLLSFCISLLLRIPFLPSYTNNNDL